MYRDSFSLECLCLVMSEHTTGRFLTPRGYRLAKSRPTSARLLRDKQLVSQIRRIHADNSRAYGVRKMWRAMQRAGWEIGRDQTARPMKLAGIPDVHRGRSPITTRLPQAPDMRPDLVQRNFRANGPNQLWVAGITYVRTRTRVRLHSVCHRCILTHDCGLAHPINHANRGIAIGSP